MPEASVTVWALGPLKLHRTAAPCWMVTLFGVMKRYGYYGADSMTGPSASLRVISTTDGGLPALAAACAFSLVSS